MNYIKKFKELQLTDLALVGGKNASLGQMICALSKKGITVPHGFAVTSKGYRHFIEVNNLLSPMKRIMSKLTDSKNVTQLKKVGSEIRALFYDATMPEDLKEEIIVAYHQLCSEYNQKNCDVAVRSSATAEDLPTASFAGQQETFLNISGNKHLVEACKKSMASLFTDRAIIYRIEHGFDHFDVALSVGVQKMIRSDLACSGVAFSLDTETGFKDVVMIESSFGLGEAVVKGSVIPDEFIVFQPTLLEGYSPIIKKKLGTKKIKLVYSNDQERPIKEEPVPENEQNAFSLTDKEILELAQAVTTIERYYSDLKSKWTPMDVEWAKDGLDNKLYIVQARPETIHAIKENKNIVTKYILDESGRKDLLQKIIVTGQSIGQQMKTGTARVIQDVSEIEQVKEGDIIVTQMTDPDWVPALKCSAGIITDRGGRTCHAAIVSRELNIPAIVGTIDGTKKIKSGSKITIDCSQGNVGFIYDGAIPFSTQTIELETLPELPVDLLVNIADPDRALSVSMLPIDGVGLARLEFIITNFIKIHPMALLEFDKVADTTVKNKINDLTKSYHSKEDFFVEKLSQGIGTIAAAFYPRPVIVRLSDFKTNEYRNLIGGSYFEPEEENPMLGFRGASRYYHDSYAPAFALECKALKNVRQAMGLKNVQIMVPFVRTIEEAEQVIKEMEKNGLKRGQDNLKCIMMCEVPSNVLLIDEFSKFFDGFSIGSNDLTQLTLGVDRDSPLLLKTFDERDAAVKKMFKMAIEGAHKNKRTIGICGQAPSDFPQLADFLIKLKIDSISLNPDSVLPFLLWYSKKRKD